MRITHLRIPLLLLCMSLPLTASAASWSGFVSKLVPTYAGYDCIYFTLEGVTEADPIVPGAQWFSIPRNQFGAKEAYATLLAAKLSGQRVEVTTNGTVGNGATSCGNAVASIVTVP